MSQHDIVSPIALSDTDQCTIIPPWFVEETEYHPTQATYLPLVNGEEAFRAVHEAIANAKKTVDIICWGFQPSMYFIRDGKEPCIGELLINIARDKNIQVRILGWESPFNSGGAAAGESNVPGKDIIRIGDREGQTATDKQHAYDREWFKMFSNSGELKKAINGPIVSPSEPARNSPTLTPVFVGRGFDLLERAEIAYREMLLSVDSGLSFLSAAAMTVAPTHHQKTVLVDYELPEDAVGFVMGHNMLDEYWDTDAHSAKRRPSDTGKWLKDEDTCEPDKGPRGKWPRQDMSCRVTGPILEHLHQNFARAWNRETEENLLLSRDAKAAAKKLKPRADNGTPVMAQLLRTQLREGKRDIEKLYLKTVNNATQYIYIENQYFRWPPLAEAIKKTVSAQIEAGRDPKKYDPLYLFVVSNVTDEGIGAGTINTQRMLESLGRADTIPEVTKQRKIEQVNLQMGGSSDYPTDTNKYLQDMLKQQSENNEKIKEIKDSQIIPISIPGLKTHICSLVAPDSPADKWMPVYVHSKIMIINDVFTTHGSANINTRSMETDSEMNIAHDWGDVTKSLRQRLWKLHTNGVGMQDDPAEAFLSWERILKQNEDNQQPATKAAPEASLVKFLYNEPTLKDQD
ncbi:phosphatidylserine/phosphatidylglycerophosphate/cardiolipin synthase-like enzyme [Rahnella sp. BIGb0603]|jgi:phosphatidylserine/phosphatidylglycerophosphate/cardiolipin synthase-like enzyme|uniref:phospholipase D-like domain-containing protein n=1 Tax=Rahnella TaxID=34037 RepID=UPI002168777F|nr:MULTISPECIES: phospholipase D-like domain-containing protein [Rahnella]MCS3425364.1 phosphatidylserine/phosphatidylglycerophosphate/cardiolipin synthase-like enzyme [Rahnella sp. BIGb0603]MDF1897268.1 phospholipase [Rahnella contaminans]